MNPIAVSKKNRSLKVIDGSAKIVLAPCVAKAATALDRVASEFSKVLGGTTDIQAHDILMIGNELASNAIKYRKPGTVIFIRLKISNDAVCIEVHNTISFKAKNSFEKYINHLKSVDLDEFYVKRMRCLQEQFHAGSAKKAMVGILTIIKDCGADVKYMFCSKSGHSNGRDYRVVARASLRLGV